MSSPVKNWARRAGINGFATLLAINSQPLEILPGSRLIIAPHPDDETLGCGGLIAASIEQGGSVHVIFLTDGEASHNGHPTLRAAQLRQQRRAEALAALAALGLPDSPAACTFLGAPDGRLDQLTAPERACIVDVIASKIRELSPVGVLTPFLGGGSSEHDAATIMTIHASEEVGGATMLEYPIWAWWNPWRLRRRLRTSAKNFRLPLAPWLARKRQALARHRTQVEASPPWREPVLPPVIASACCGRHEFYFLRSIFPTSSPHPQP